jgi:NADH-quinone oxidoreductase subunit A
MVQQNWVGTGRSIDPLSSQLLRKRTWAGIHRMEQTSALWPLALYGAATAMLVSGMIGVSYLLGPRHSSRAMKEPFESGLVPLGYARFRFPAKFYLIAMFFVIFDLEAVFIFAWAIAFRDVGWPGYAEVLVFIGILAAALAYLWRSGALDWGPRPVRSRTFTVSVSDSMWSGTTGSGPKTPGSVR